MSALANSVLTDSAAVARTFTPQSNTNGIAKWQYKVVNAPIALYPKMSLSVRQGQPANVATGALRIKRKVTIKTSAAYDTGFSYDDGTPRYDSVDMEMTFSVPVDALTAAGNSLPNAIVFAKNLLADLQFTDAITFGDQPF